MPSDQTFAEETFLVDSPVVGCDGGGGALGHPLVYLNIGAEGEIMCPYCSRRFILKDGAGTQGGH
jgi:uncharacterized Zn-finger protein